MVDALPRSPHPLILLFVSLALAACTPDGGDGDGDRDGDPSDATEMDGATPAGDAGPDPDPDMAVEPPDPFVVPAEVAFEGLRDAFGRARCRFDDRCGVGFAGTEPALCIQTAGDYAWHVEAVERMRALGRLNYDPATMGACLSWLAERPCEAVGRTHGVRGYDGGRDYFVRDRDTDWLGFEPCRQALLGDGQAGDGCLHGVECASGTCSVFNSNQCGECIGRGGDCAETYCADDERCDYDTDRCLPRLGEGEDCRNDSWCDSDLRCDNAPVAPGMCVGLGPVGRECDDANHNSGMCPIESICLRDTCQDLEMRVAVEGEPCGYDAGDPNCRPDLRCRGDDEGNNRTCRRFEVGDECGWSNLPSSQLDRFDGCALSEVCDDLDRCAVPKQMGEPCRSTRDCDFHLFCEPESRQCQPRLGEGEVCSAYPMGGECAYPLSCVGSRLFGTDDGTCQLGAGLGEACGGKEDCAPDLSCNDSISQCVFFGSSFFGCR